MSIIVMWKLCLVILAAAFLVLCTADYYELPLNPQATLLSEVRFIKHDEISRQVVIVLAEERRCHLPTFMVRLSGASLYILDKVHHNDSKPDMMIFSYPALVDVGIYFLEVLTLYCETLKPNDLRSMCLIHPKDGQNILTLPYKFEVKTPEASTFLRHRWDLRSNATSALLPTRYQHMCGGTYCKSSELDIVQHNLYEWTGKMPLESMKKAFLLGLSNLTTHTPSGYSVHTTNSTNTTHSIHTSHTTNTTHPHHPNSGNESITICMVGASHAGQVYLHSLRLDLPSYVRFVWVQSRYPQLFDVSLLTNCTYAVIGYGQWQLSAWMQGNPYNAEKHELHIRNILQSIKSANIRTQVFMRSMNISPLGYVYTDCPATDFRHPPIVMMYNSVVSRLCAEYDIPYKDMFHLQAPLWDIALDWNHPLGRVFNAEVMHILHYTTTYSITHHHKPVLEHNHYLRPNVNYHYLVRFSDSEVVYLLIGNKFRAIASRDSMFHMGYTADMGFGDNNIPVIDAKLKPLELIGPPLPEI